MRVQGSFLEEEGNEQDFDEGLILPSNNIKKVKLASFDSMNYSTNPLIQTGQVTDGS
jgi:hypothetical protein